MNTLIRILSFTFAVLAAVCSFSHAQDANPEYSLSIEDYLNNALPPQEGRIINFSDITGILTITDTPSNQRLITKLVKQFDVGPKQILIEARFVEIQFEDLDELGIEWYWYKHGDFDFNSSTIKDYQNIRWDNTATDTFPQNSDSGLDVAIAYFKGTQFLMAYLHTLASEGRANLLSSPKVTTLSGQQANIQITQAIPYVSDVAFENSGTAEHPIWKFNYTIEEKITGITLEVTPYVSESSDVINLEIHPEVSSLLERRPIFVGSANNPITAGQTVPELLGWPVIDTRTTQTSVMVSSGSTVVMGGFIHDNVDSTYKKVPVLGDIPLIGNLFKYKNVSRAKTNLVIFLTATLITAEGEAVTPAAFAR